MNEYVFVSERGDDRHDGLQEERPVRSAKRAIEISIRTGRNIRVLGNWDTVGRLEPPVVKAPILIGCHV
jgi:hypothetical protein